MTGNVKQNRKCLVGFLFALLAMLILFSVTAFADVTVERVDFFNDSTQIFKVCDGSVASKASITSASGGESVALITAVYDSTNMILQDVDYCVHTLTAGTNYYNASKNVTSEDDSHIVVFVWDSITLSPYSGSFELTDKSQDTLIDVITATKDTKVIKGLLDVANKIIRFYTDEDLSAGVTYNVTATDNTTATASVDAVNNTCTVTAEDGKTQAEYAVYLYDNMNLKFYADYTGSEIVNDEGRLPSNNHYYSSSQKGVPSYGTNYNNNTFENPPYGCWWFDTSRSITIDIVDDIKESGNKALKIDKSNQTYANNRIFFQPYGSGSTCYFATGRIRFSNNTFGIENNKYRPTYRLYFGGVETLVSSGSWTTNGKTIKNPVGIDNWHEYTVVQHRPDTSTTATADFYYDGKLVYSGTRGTDYAVGGGKDFDSNFGIGVRAAESTTVGSVFMDDNIILTK